MRALRIAVVDDHGMIRDGIAAILPGYDVVGRYADVASLLAERADVDVVLLDLDLAGTADAAPVQGAAAVRAVAAAGYRSLIYTNERRRRVLVACVAAGASGVVHKAEPMADLAAAIDTIARGGLVITTALAGLAELYARRGELPQLTPRQCEILTARARGTSNRRIAERLHLSVRTVEDHMSVIGRKFAGYLATHSAADLERHLGIGRDDLVDWRAPDLTVPLDPIPNP